MILTAIPLEYDVVLEVEDGTWPNGRWSKERIPETGMPIAFRTFRGKGNQPLQIAVALARDMGPMAAAIDLTHLVVAYSPRCVAMAGVCAGRPEKTNLGDVIAAERLFLHDTGKQLPEGVEQDIRTYNLRGDWVAAIERFDFRARFQSAAWWRKRPITYEWQENWVLAKLNEGTENPNLLPECTDCCQQWEDVIEGLTTSGDVRIRNKTLVLTKQGRLRIDKVLIQHKGRIPDLSPLGKKVPFKVHVAPIGSGSKVIEDEKIWGFVSQHSRKTRGIEMEAAAIGAVADALRARRLDAVVMKGVMDFANNGRDDHFKIFAARAAAECLIAFLRDEFEPIANKNEDSIVLREEAVPAETGASVKEATHPAVQTRPSKVLSIGRPSGNQEQLSEQPQLPSAQHVAVATLLGSLVANDDIFRRACAAAELPPELFWAATSPTDRWFSAIATGAQSGTLGRLVETAAAALPPAFKWRVRMTDAEVILRAPRWNRGDLYKYRDSLGRERGGGGAGNPDIVGILALRHLWGNGEPDLGPLRRYLNEIEDTGSSIGDEVDPASSGRDHQRELELGLAAEHLVAWCTAGGGDQLIAWILEHVNHASPSRVAVVTAAVHWWDKGRKELVHAAQGMRDQPLDLVPRKSIDVALARLSALDRLLSEADAAWWGAFDNPPSVHLAVRAGRRSSVAQLLEAVGERRPAIFIDQIARFHNDREAVVALARVLRRLRIARVGGDPIDQELSLALRCSLPEATVREINLLTEEPRMRAWWLDLLSPPLSDAQIAALIKIYGTSRHTLERDRARRWLCTTLDPLSVWQRLPEAHRRQWVEDLTDFELLLIGRLAGHPPPVDLSEQQDWTRLQQRIASAKNTADRF